MSATAAPGGAKPAVLEGSSTPGRATGSGKWGYVGQFGQLNGTSAAAPGQFYLPYAIDIQNDVIAVTDSGNARWENASLTTGHTVQTFQLVNAPGSAGHGDYVTDGPGGQYRPDAQTKSGADPYDLVEPLGFKHFEVNSPRGPRGAAFAPDDSLYVTTYEDGLTGGADQHADMVRRFIGSDLGAVTLTFAPSTWKSPGESKNTVGVDVTSDGLVVEGHSIGVNIFAPDGTYLTSIGQYFDAEGANQASRVQWSTRAADVREWYGKPDAIGETYGLSVVEEEGKLVVYVGDAGAYFGADPAVHFVSGVSGPQFTKPASIKRYIVERSGGVRNDRFNPEGWKWTLDTSFGVGGAVQFGGNSLFPLFGKTYFQAQAVFGLKADLGSNTLYFSLNGAAGPVVGALDLHTGRPIQPAPAPVNGARAGQDSAMAYVRGISVDSRGLVYMTTQGSPGRGNSRAIVQIWGKTPTAMGQAIAEPGVNTAKISWPKSVAGYQQPDTLNYTLDYRALSENDLKASSARQLRAWRSAQTSEATRGTDGEDRLGSAPKLKGSLSTTELASSLADLLPDTEYEATITPWNEAGSGDPTRVRFRTVKAVPAMTVVKTGDGKETPSAADAAHVLAGSSVSFGYTVTNTGNVPLFDIKASDDRLGSLVDPQGFNGRLAPEESVVYRATGDVPAGSYDNTVTVTAQPKLNAKHDDPALREDPGTLFEPITASDTWYGFGDVFSASLVKKGNGAAAPTPGEAVRVPADSQVAFTYEVTNTGNTDLSGLDVADDLVAPITPAKDFSGTLAAGETTVFSGTGVVEAGPYVNHARVKSKQASPATAEWHGFGVTHGLTLVKRGNGEVATTQETAVHAPADSSVTFEYVVTNTGNVAATNVRVADDRVSVLTPPAGFDGTLEPGASATFTASDTLRSGAYVNTATASADGAAPVSMTWHGFGDRRGLSIAKTGSGVAAPAESGAVHVPAGSQVAFSYAVTNTGNVDAVSVSVTDDRIASLTPPLGFAGVIKPGESAVFTAASLVEAGPYVNVAKAVAPGFSDVTSVWHGFGDAPALAVKKTGDGMAAPTDEDAICLPSPRIVTFDYAITNTGNVALTGISLSDDRIAELAPPRGFTGRIEPGETVVFTASGAVAGDYVNVARATADGGTSASSEWHAKVKKQTDQPSPSPTHVPEPTGTPSPSPTSSPVPTGEPTTEPTPGSTSTPAPTTTTPVETPSVTVTPTNAPTDDSSPTASPTPDPSTPIASSPPVDPTAGSSAEPAPKPSPRESNAALPDTGAPETTGLWLVGLALALTGAGMASVRVGRRRE